MFLGIIIITIIAIAIFIYLFMERKEKFGDQLFNCNNKYPYDRDGFMKCMQVKYSKDTIKEKRCRIKCKGDKNDCFVDCVMANESVWIK